jgi:hypothetical protein
MAPTVAPERSAADYARELATLGYQRQRPLARLYGANGPTPDQEIVACDSDGGSLASVCAQALDDMLFGLEDEATR